MDGYLPVTGDALTRFLVGVFRLNGALLASGDRVVADFGLTSSRWQVLSVVANSPSPLPVASIARNMGLTRQGVRQTVADLRADGLMALQPNPHHSTARLVVLTPEGRRAHEAAKERWARWLSGLGAGDTEESFEAAAQLLTNLLARVDDAAERAVRAEASGTGRAA